MYIRAKSFVESSGCRTCPLEISERRLRLTHYWRKSKMYLTFFWFESAHNLELRREMSHVWMSHVTDINESCHTYGWVMSQIWMSHVTRMNEWCLMYKWVMSHISSICVTWRFNCMCDMSRPRVWHDSFICVTRLINSHDLCEIMFETAHNLKVTVVGFKFRFRFKFRCRFGLGFGMWI